MWMFGWEICSSNLNGQFKILSVRIWFGSDRGVLDIFDMMVWFLLECDFIPSFIIPHLFLECIKLYLIDFVIQPSAAYYRGAMGIILVYDVTDESSFNSKVFFCVTLISSYFISLVVLFLFYFSLYTLDTTYRWNNCFHLCFWLDIVYDCAGDWKNAF